MTEASNKPALDSTGGEINCVNPLKTKFLHILFKSTGPYRKVNTTLYHWKDQYVNAV
jgi:hypothetical protein